MGFFSKAFSNPLKGAAIGGLVGGGAGALAGGLFGKKNQDNAEIDAQMQDPGSPPGMLDPNNMGGNPTGLSAYGRMAQQNNALMAGKQNQDSQMAVAGEAAGARSNLAARGGLSSGASERIGLQGMGAQANERQKNAYSLMQANGAAAQQDLGNQMQWNQNARLANQQMQGQLYAGNTMANATLNANRPKGMLGLGIGPF